MAKKPTPGTSPSSPDELPEGRYSDRELSWLAFNERVLDLARDAERIPLLERAKFLAIFSSNLDEFFMVRPVKGTFGIVWRLLSSVGYA